VTTLDGYLGGAETIETLQSAVATAAGALDNQHIEIRRQLEQLEPSLEEIRFARPQELQKAEVERCFAGLQAAIAADS
jgi:hypothetical protein